LTVNASIAAFELRDSNNNPYLGSNGQPIGGRVRSDVLDFYGKPFRGNFNLIGGEQSSNFDNLGVYDGKFHGYLYKGKWDARYDNGHRRRSIPATSLTPEARPERLRLSSDE